MSQTAREAKKSGEGGAWEIIRVFIHALILAFLVRTFAYQPFNIPSGSMKSTLLVGDYLFVSKFSYGYSRYSLPFSPPLFSGRIWTGLPERGDVAVFKLPTNNSTDYIKRVIGLPNDRIQVIDGVLHINGEAVKREKTDDFTETDAAGNVTRIQRYVETLPNGVSYDTLDIYSASFGDNTREYVVPEGHYFMMGDNRDNSTDSRFLSDVGYVPLENFVGRAEVIFFSIDGSAQFWQVWKWPTSIRWSRLLDGVG
ncbi:MAG: signal peptidase I [Methyloligellaceae bacterium]